MRKILSCIIMLLVLAAGAAALWFILGRPKPGEPMVESVEKFVNPPAQPPPARGPLDYHVLQDQGGIAKAEAVRAGLAGAGYAYLCSQSPVQISDGVETAEGISVRGKRYDLGFRFASRPPAEQYLEYNLSAKWDTLDFGFGFCDTEPSDPSGKLAIVLEIRADGKPIYTSPELRPTDKPVFTNVPVTGVNRLLIVVRRVGLQNQFAPVLLDPFFKTAAPKAAS